MAGGLNAYYGNAVWVYPYDQPGIQLFSGTYGAQIPSRGLAFKSNGHSVFAVSSGSTVTFTPIDLQPPTLGGLAPTRGSAAGGTAVTITGSGFFAGTAGCQVTGVSF